MKRSVLSFLLIIFSLFQTSHGASAFDEPLDISKNPTFDWIPKDTDWDKAEIVVIRFDDFSYTPNYIILRKNQPYKFVFENSGDLPHNLADLDFFHSLAIKEVVGEFGRIRTPHIHSIFINKKTDIKNNKLTIFGIPTITGEFTIYCSIGDHREEGMEGIIRVIP